MHRWSAVEPQSRKRKRKRKRRGGWASAAAEYPAPTHLQQQPAHHRQPAAAHHLLGPRGWGPAAHANALALERPSEWRQAAAAAAVAAGGGVIEKTVSGGIGRLGAAARWGVVRLMAPQAVLHNHNNTAAVVVHRVRVTAAAPIVRSCR